jgi:cell division protein FtsQ
MPVSAPADRRFRRAHLRPARKRSGWAGWRWREVASVIVVGFALYATHRATGVVAGLKIFEVQRIAVRGNHRLSSGEVVAQLEGLRGQSILSVDLEEWRRGVLSSPWVADASLRRTLPSTVDVVVQERAPLGIGRMNGELYLVDDRGAVIDRYGPGYADLDLPVIDGLSSAPDQTDSDVSRAALARRLLDALRARGMAARISQIDVSDARNAVVLLDGDPTLIRLGNERFVERLQSYIELAPAMRERVQEIDYVDLRFGERVYVRPASQPVGHPNAHHSDGGASSGAPAAAPRASKRSPVKRGRGIRRG